MGSLKNERLLIQVRRESERSSINAYQMRPFASSPEGPVMTSPIDSFVRVF
jgi:hypothetical protein